MLSLNHFYQCSYMFWGKTNCFPIVFPVKGVWVWNVRHLPLPRPVSERDIEYNDDWWWWWKFSSVRFCLIHVNVKIININFFIFSYSSLLILNFNICLDNHVGQNLLKWNVRSIIFLLFVYVEQKINIWCLMSYNLIITRNWYLSNR